MSLSPAFSIRNIFHRSSDNSLVFGIWFENTTTTFGILNRITSLWNSDIIRDQLLSVRKTKIYPSYSAVVLLIRLVHLLFSFSNQVASLLRIHKRFLGIPGTMFFLRSLFDQLPRLLYDQMEKIYCPVIVAAIYVILYWKDYALAYSFCKVWALPHCSSRERVFSRTTLF